MTALAWSRCWESGELPPVSKITFSNKSEISLSGIYEKGIFLVNPVNKMRRVFEKCSLGRIQSERDLRYWQQISTNMLCFWGEVRRLWRETTTIYLSASTLVATFSSRFWGYIPLLRVRVGAQISTLSNSGDPFQFTPFPIAMLRIIARSNQTDLCKRELYEARSLTKRISP